MVRIFAFGVLLGGCADGESGGRQDDILALSSDLASGESLFDANCQSCHAADGSGGLGSNIQQVDVDLVVDAMLNGRTGMESYADLLTDQEMADIAGYVETL